MKFISERLIKGTLRRYIDNSLFGLFCKSFRLLALCIIIEI